MAYYVNNALIKEVPTTPDASRGAFLISTGTGYDWAYAGNANAGIAVDNSGWRYRSIYTHGYLACGYKGSNPWRSLNKTWHPTDTTFYCGEQIMTASAYTNGTWSDYNGYIVANGYSTAGTVVASYGLHNGTCRMWSGDGWGSSGTTYGYVGNDPKNEGISYGNASFGSNVGVGGMRLNVSRSDPICMEDIKGQSGWIVGGGSSTSSRIHFATEVMYGGWDSGTDGIGDGAGGELRGYAAWAATYRYVTWSNSTWSGTGTWGGWSRDGHCNTQSTKWGHHYIGNGSNVTLGKSKFRDSDGVTISNFNKVRSYGEDNTMEGQDWGYIMGHFDGQQNNHTIKQSHSSDTEVTMGATCMPKGHYGQSSGACSTAAATVTATGVGM